MKQVRDGFNRDGTERVFSAFPITAQYFIDGVVWSRLGTPAEEAAKGELKRMLDIYERHRAYFNPVRKGDLVQWEVCFPGQGRWKSGPVERLAEDAFKKNYLLNKKFAGEQVLPKGDGETPLHLDKILTEGQREDDRAAEAGGLEP